jgi:hypothetical protein
MDLLIGVVAVVFGITDLLILNGVVEPCTGTVD